MIDESVFAKIIEEWAYNEENDYGNHRKIYSFDDEMNKESPEDTMNAQQSPRTQSVHLIEAAMRDEDWRLQHVDLLHDTQCVDDSLPDLVSTVEVEGSMKVMMPREVLQRWLDDHESVTSDSHEHSDI